MKTRFSTYDLICSVTELQRLIGMRVHQVYDIDSKTYLIRLQLGEKKAVLLLESGTRIHTTSFEWPKNVAPSGFSMKMRKHIKNKRLEKLNQLGIDRIVDLQFGSGEAAYHVILELYDRGNIILTDYSYTILNLLRPHTEGDAVKFAVRETYPSDRGKRRLEAPSEELISKILAEAKPDDQLKKTFNIHLEYGPAIIEHVLLLEKFVPTCKIKDINATESAPKLKNAFIIAEKLIDDAFVNTSKGYIIQKNRTEGKETELLCHVEFHPIISEQNKNRPYIEYETFDRAVDEYFSNMESQKIDMKGAQQEMAALKKLENVKKDHEKRIISLEQSQVVDTVKAELITRNQTLVDDAITAIRQAIASQMSWTDIHNLVKEATNCGDSVASAIKELKLNINHITIHLSDPYEEFDETGEPLLKPALVDVDLDLSAYANAKKYYDKKRQAAFKQKKTVESQDKAFKSAEKKTKQTLKEVKTGVSISKARKVYWFEKFYWFISSENYLVIGGRDQQQNELIVKRYLKTNDIYVHAGLVGASSVVIKNFKNEPVPPKTLNEAGTMAMCYSNAWEAKVVTSAWWVHANQVSKTAPTGEYLTTGSFMIRGKKNFLPQCHLIMGFTFMFRLEESSVERHADERRKKDFDELQTESDGAVDDAQDNVELYLSADSEDEEQNKNELSTIEEDQETYPDTQVVVERTKDTTECKVNVKLSRLRADANSNENKVENFQDDDYVIFLGDDKPVIIKPGEAKHKPSKQVAVTDTRAAYQNEMKSEPDSKQQSKQKRGHKSKLKKIKEKYKDQDEEERELRMRILQGTPKQKEKKKRKDKKGKMEVITAKMEKQAVKPPPAPPPIQLLSVDENVNIGEMNREPVDDEDDKDEAIESSNQADIDMLNALTGLPVAEDELLFAVPVVAPYNAIVNYKYKVKLTPGTGKRGKAAKTALNVFLKDKSSTAREKDLIKFVKDQDLARNFPGKVKLSAPLLSKHKS